MRYIIDLEEDDVDEVYVELPKFKKKYRILHPHKRKKGKWIVGGRQGGKVISRKCSECGWHIKPNTDNMNYCPRCGAEMTEGEDED